MKKTTLIVASSILFLGACSLLNTGSTGSNSADISTIAKLKSCTFEEATNKVKDGSAFTKGISVTADEISNSCVKKLALQSAGLDNTATEEATSALESLMNAYNGK
ncbi:MAG: hypothetical protein ACK5N8_07105 [Alphaproteobacteria bacterium]